MNMSEQINELASALSKMQSELCSASKDAANPFFKSKYADLPACWDACKIPMTKNGLSLCQCIDEKEDGKATLTTVLMHSSGQWMKSVTPLPYEKNGKNECQALGSAITYMRRYAMSAMLGIVQDDDDANSAFSQKPKHITKIQAHELQTLLSQCDEKFREQVIKWISNPAIGASTIYELPAIHFETLKNDMLKRIQTIKNAQQTQTAQNNE